MASSYIFRLYQYNEDDFSIQVLISNEFFWNYKFTSKQRDAVNLRASFCFHVYVYPYCLKTWKK